jgi:Protein of unknown function, DUF599
MRPLRLPCFEGRDQPAAAACRLSRNCPSGSIAKLFPGVPLHAHLIDRRRYRGRLFLLRMDGVRSHPRAHRLRPGQPFCPHECLSGSLDLAHAGPGSANGRHANHGKLAKRHGAFRFNHTAGGGRGTGAAAATNEVMPIIEKLPMGLSASPGLWEIKCIVLLLIFFYAFFNSPERTGCSIMSPSCASIMSPSCSVGCHRHRSATRWKRKRM